MNLTRQPNPARPTIAEIIAILGGLVMAGTGLLLWSEPGYLLVPPVLLGFLAGALVSIVMAIFALFRQPRGRGTSVFRILDVVIVLLGIPALMIVLFITYAVAATL